MEMMLWLQTRGVTKTKLQTKVQNQISVGKMSYDMTNLSAAMYARCAVNKKSNLTR